MFGLRKGRWYKMGMLELKDKETYVLLENDVPDSFNEKIRSDKK